MADQTEQKIKLVNSKIDFLKLPRIQREKIYIKEKVIWKME